MTHHRQVEKPRLNREAPLPAIPAICRQGCFFDECPIVLRDFVNL
jgi:hypothetical protein